MLVLFPDILFSDRPQVHLQCRQGAIPNRISPQGLRQPQRQNRDSIFPLLPKSGGYGSLEEHRQLRIIDLSSRYFPIFLLRLGHKHLDDFWYSMRIVARSTCADSEELYKGVFNIGKSSKHTFYFNPISRISNISCQ